MDNKKRIETVCVQGGYTPKNGEPRQIPIYQSTTFKYDTSEDMGNNIYYNFRYRHKYRCLHNSDFLG